jgi:hypothetical protein
MTPKERRNARNERYRNMIALNDKIVAMERRHIPRKDIAAQLGVSLMYVTQIAGMTNQWT